MLSPAQEIKLKNILQARLNVIEQNGIGANGVNPSIEREVMDDCRELLYRIQLGRYVRKADVLALHNKMEKIYSGQRMLLGALLDVADATGRTTVSLASISSDPLA